MKNISNNFWHKKRVAVTGSSGFLGSHFVSELRKNGAVVTPITRDQTDLLDLDQTKKSFQGIEIVINCAAIDGNAEFKQNHAAEILDGNIRIASNVLNASRDNHIKDVVLVSSSEIYSSYAPNPIKEEDDYRLYGGHSSSGYILSKRYGEILAELYQEQYGLKIYLPRPSNIFGPGDHFGDQSTRVVPSFITKIMNGLPIEIWGDGSQTRQFVFVEDVVRTVLTMVEKQMVGKLNISSNEHISILDLAKTISKILDTSADIRLDPSKSTGAKNRLLDISAMQSLIDFSPVTLESGLHETILWYKQKNNL